MLITFFVVGDFEEVLDGDDKEALHEDEGVLGHLISLEINVNKADDVNNYGDDDDNHNDDGNNDNNDGMVTTKRRRQPLATRRRRRQPLVTTRRR